MGRAAHTLRHFPSCYIGDSRNIFEYACSSYSIPPFFDHLQFDFSYRLKLCGQSSTISPFNGRSIHGNNSRLIFFYICFHVTWALLPKLVQIETLARNLTNFFHDWVQHRFKDWSIPFTATTEKLMYDFFYHFYDGTTIFQWNCSDPSIFWRSPGLHRDSLYIFSFDIVHLVLSSNGSFSATGFLSCLLTANNETAISWQLFKMRPACMQPPLHTVSHNAPAKNNASPISFYPFFSKHCSLFI